MEATETFAGSFANPVMEAQAIFRFVMDGFANPGQVGLAGSTVDAPEPFGKAAASILLTLCDFETTVWLSPSLASSAIHGWVKFNSGAPLVSEPKQSVFAFLASTAELPELSLFELGNDEYPDTSTTVVLEIAALDGGLPLLLEGPGINRNRLFAPRGLPDGFEQAWANNQALYPRGIDLILTASDQFVCLPRTTRIREA